MLTMSRRAVLGSAAAAAAFGLSSKLEFVLPALAATPLEPTVGFYKYKVGDVEVTAIYDGIWKNRTIRSSSRMPRSTIPNRRSQTRGLPPNSCRFR